MREERFDIVVVGAGAAGLAAARFAARAGARVVVLEAKTRVGGRAYCERESLGLPFDHGCHWFHSASRNPLVPIAQAAGRRFETTPLPLRIRTDGVLRGDDDVARWRRYAERQFERVAAAGHEERLPGSAADVIEPDPLWRALFRGWFAMLSGADPAEVCAGDHARYLDTGENWVLAEGYGTFLAEHFAGVPVRLACPALAIGIGEREVEVRTAHSRLHAEAVVVSVSTAVLASGRIDFEPRLPEAKRQAIAALPLGYAEKVGFSLAPDCDLWAGRSHVLLSVRSGEVVSFQIRPHGWPLVSAYFGGRRAAETTRRGAGALTEEALAHLSEHAGCSLTDALTATVETAWTTDPDVLGGYSSALPRRPPDVRRTLAEPWLGRVYFAGEATSVHAYSTAHGAYESGARAAGEALRRIGAR